MFYIKSGDIILPQFYSTLLEAEKMGRSVAMSNGGAMVFILVVVSIIQEG